jgi:two-component system sensor histidine kinase/response regulator
MRCNRIPGAGANILIVDDTRANLELLSSMLQSRGYRVRPAPSGELALQAAQREAPDIVLLDINMPGMSGYEVCERMKADPKLAAVPVIFVSALGETLDKVKGFGLGAVDYVTKPFDLEEVEVRVSTHLELSRLRRQLEFHNRHLEELVDQRTRQLAEAHARLAILDQAKSDFLGLISHEVRTPLVGVFGAAEMLLEICSADPAAAECGEIYKHSRRRLMTLLDDALLLTEIGAGAVALAHPPSLLEEILDQALALAAPFAQFRGVRMMPAPKGLALVRGHPDHHVRALQSLLETAVKFAHPGGLVRLAQADAPGETRLFIEADGEQIPPEALPRFFSLLAIAEPITPGGDLGLAPPLAERIVTLYGGAVAVENLQPAGIRLSVRLRNPEDNLL